MSEPSEGSPSSDRRAEQDRRRVSRGGRRATDKIACPYCARTRSTVIDSRPSKRGDGYWRRRECADCHKRFVTEEVIRTTYRGSYPEDQIDWRKKTYNI